jgi:4-amino-4-deoxy-L-arabinose transferase-like glycosyltransferase
VRHLLYTDKNLIRKKAGISAGLFALAFLPRVLGLNTFITFDETKWMSGYTVDFLMALMRGEFTATYQRFHPGVTTMWSASAGLTAQYLLEKTLGVVQPSLVGFQEYLEAVPVLPSSARFLTAERLPAAFATSIAVVLMYSLVGKLFNSRIAFLSAAMLALDPLYLAYSRLVLPDALLTSFMTLSFLSFMVCLKHGWSLRCIAFSGITAGLALLTKVPAALLVPIIGILTTSTLFLEARKGRQLQWQGVRQVVLALTVWGILAAFVFFLFWPAMWVDHVGTLKATFFGAANQTINPRRQPPDFFWGNVTAGPDPGPLFYPVVLLFRVTPLTFLGTAISLVMLSGRGQERLIGGDRKNIVMLLVYAVFITFVVSWRVLKADRFFLPIFPAIEIVAAFGLYGLAGRVIRRLKLDSLQNRVWTIGLLLMVLLQAAFCLPYHPYYLSYYNPLFGGGSQASKTMRVGWGEGMDRAAQYLSRKENAISLTVAVTDGGDLSFAPFFVGELLPLSRQRLFWDDVDYAVVYLAQAQRLLIDTEVARYLSSLKPEHTARINGIEYARIYEINKPLPASFQPFQHTQKVKFGDQILLLGYDLYNDSVGRDGDLKINLYWQALRRMEEDYTVYLKLVNDVYHIWGQQDSRPVWDGSPTNTWEQGQVVGDKRELEVLPGTPPGLYQIEVILMDLHSGRTLESEGGGSVLLGPIEVSRWEPLSTDHLDIEKSLEVNLGNKVQLLGYNIESGFRPGDNVHLVLFWRCLEEMEQGYTVFTQLVDAGDNIVAQKDSPPADGFYPTAKWEVGEVVRDQYDLVIPTNTALGEYKLQVGMYLVETGERLPLVGDRGLLLEDKVVLQLVSVKDEL